MLYWSKGFSVSCYLNSNDYPDRYGRFDVLVGAGVLQSVTGDSVGGWGQLERFRAGCPDWLMGHLAYELKEHFYGAGPSLPDETDFPALFFFQPEILLILKGHELQVGLPEASVSGSAESVLRDIGQARPPEAASPHTPATWQNRMAKEEYLHAVEVLQGHLLRGDAYEVNFCRESFLQGREIDPHTLFDRLNLLSPAPFSALYRLGDRFLISSSPERFLQKAGAVIISQPMKGTIRRGGTPREDELLKHRLWSSAKEQSENVMAVDLVRNDLSRTAVPGSVKVEELFGIQSFPQVHQLVTTVSALAAPASTPEQILAHAFPMGSMTGAPKHRVLQLIDRFERTRRGLYSGALGYFTPGGDFDFNVVIRSILYHAQKKHLSIQTGSGITVYSHPEQEWEECVLKAEALQRAVG